MRRLCRFAVVVGAGALVLSMMGCTPDEPDDGSSPSAAPSSPAASPSESEADRAERERGEHAIEVYEKSAIELDQLLQAGEEEPSAEFKQYADGAYLEAAAGLLKQVSDEGSRLDGASEVVGIWVEGVAAEKKVRLVSCEDGSDSRYIDKDGNPMPNDEPMVIQSAEVEPVAGDTWKVTYVESEFFESFEGTECADAA